MRLDLGKLGVAQQKNRNKLGYKTFLNPLYSTDIL